MKYDDILNELSDSAKNEIRKMEWHSKEQRDAQLDAAYFSSPSEYNELFDEFERNDREARRLDGTYSLDDYLDDLEDERKRDHSRMM